MKDRTILHCDLNNFYASVECLKAPHLREVPMAVSGSSESRTGIILAKNELAKQKGVKTAEVIWQAKQKCPNLVLVPPNMRDYRAMSRRVFEIYLDYTDLVEPFGIDECWLDVTGSKLLFGDGETIANTIRERVKFELGLTISVGVSFSKVFAKLGSDIKKPDAVTVISRENYKQVVWSLPVADLLYVGKATNKTLSSYGIYTIGELANCDINFLNMKFGKNGYDLSSNANGNDYSIIPHYSHKEKAKSIGKSITTPKDICKKEDIWRLLLDMSQTISTKLREDKLVATGVQITVRFTDMTTKDIQGKLEVPTRLTKELSSLGLELYEKSIEDNTLIRMLGIRAINLIDEDESVQINLFEDSSKLDSLEVLEEKIDDINKTLGKNTIKRGSQL